MDEIEWETRVPHSSFREGGVSQTGSLDGGSGCKFFGRLRLKEATDEERIVLAADVATCQR